MNRDDATLGELLHSWFTRMGLPTDGGYGARFVPLKFGPLRFALPNIPARVAAVKWHDLHHLLTGYPTSWVGEAQISAWNANVCGRK